MKNREIIAKMIGYIEKIENYCNGISYDDFASSSMRMEACVFNLGQIGEAVTKLDDNFLAANVNIPWRQMKGLRNKIVHDYDGVDPVLVWQIIENDLSVLKKQLESID